MVIARRKQTRESKSGPRNEVRAWQFQDILLEFYDYAPGKAEVCEAHVHHEYQICLSLDFPGSYDYRGAYHAVPEGSLSILHPGEKHASADPEDRAVHSHYCLFYLPPDLLRKVVRWNEAEGLALPFFPSPIVMSDDLFRGFLDLHRLLGTNAALLEQESRLQSLLLNLAARHAEGTFTSPVIRRESFAVQRIRAHIEDNYRENIALVDLARLIDRHPIYVNAMFQQLAGVPPHAYQTQIRIDRAKRLLASGIPVSEAARLVGFYDQSHFGRHFRRHTGITPARYRALRTS